jgi:hypothetical protein
VKHAPAPDFTRLKLSTGGTIAAALTEHRVLVAMFYNTFFVIANTTDRSDAIADADNLNNEQEGLRPVFIILLADEHLAALDAGVDHLNVAVLTATRGYRHAATAIKATASTGTNARTAYGTVASTVVTSADLRAGDVYTLGTPTLGSDVPGWTVYRALADYNPQTGRVEHHIVTDDWKPSDYHGALTEGPDNIAFRVDDPAEFLARYGNNHLLLPAAA